MRPARHVGRPCCSGHAHMRRRGVLSRAAAAAAAVALHTHGPLLSARCARLGAPQVAPGDDHSGRVPSRPDGRARIGCVVGLRDVLGGRDRARVGRR
eukprot:5230682-Prymnesium_polylepis.1